MILVVEDENPELYVRRIEQFQHENVADADRLPVEYATSFEEAEAYFSAERIRSRTFPRLVLVDMTFPRGSLAEDELAGYKLIEKYAPQCEDVEWVAMTGIVEWHETEVEPGVSLFDALYYRFQLLDVYEKGDPSRLESTLHRFFLPKTPPTKDYFELKLNGGSFITSSFEYQHKLRMVARETERGVLIFGEDGTRKDVVAKAIHVLSRRSGDFDQRDGTSVLFKSEFSSDAASGSTSPRLATLEGGTLYVSHIDQVPLDLQGQIMRGCAMRNVRLIGGIDTPRKQFLEKQFLEGDLIQLEMLAAFIPFDVPALRERPEDIPPLVEYFVRQFNQLHGKHKDLRGRDQIYGLIASAAWRDNVAGLESVVEQVLRETVSDQITRGDFEQVLESRPATPEGEEEFRAPPEVKVTKPPIVVTEDDLRRYGLR